MSEQENELRFTIYIRSFGKKSKCVRDVGRSLSKALHLMFGDRYRIVDHRSQPIDFDPNEHDWGVGEA